ncbi:MAG: hypothetical protein ABIP33_04660 [Pseudolysinimonas sp.]
MPRPARAQRLARGWIVGLVATTVAAVSHSLAGGYQPGLLSFGTALVFAGMLGTFVIGRRPSLPRLAVVVGVSQLAFHLMFSLLGEGAGAGGTAARLGMSNMSAMSAMGAPIPTAPLSMPPHTHLADPGMWVSHAVAAVLTILFLRHAELAVWRMLTRLGRVLATRLTVVLVPVASGSELRTPAWPTIARRPAQRLLVASASRRGPPLLAF